MNKFILINILFIILSASCTSKSQQKENPKNHQQNSGIMDSGKLIVRFILTHREVSKDSNGKTILIEIYENVIKVSKRYTGFKAQDDEYYEKEITPETQGKIIEFIKEKGLNKNLQEQKSTEGIGIEVYFSFHFYDKDTTVILINGKKNIWGSDDYVKKNWGEKYVKSRTNIDNLVYLDIATDFISFISNL